MLFLFEFLFFGIALAVIVAGEALGRDWAMFLGIGITACSLVGRVVVGRRVPLPAGQDRATFHAASEDARWWRTTLDSWSHFNRALLVGCAALVVWAAIARVATGN